MQRIEPFTIGQVLTGDFLVTNDFAVDGIDGARMASIMAGASISLDEAAILDAHFGMSSGFFEGMQAAIVYLRKQEMELPKTSADALPKAAIVAGDLEPTPSSEMIEAGLGVLHRSGAVETPLPSDRLLVEEIYLAMATCRRR